MKRIFLFVLSFYFFSTVCFCDVVSPVLAVGSCQEIKVPDLADQTDVMSVTRAIPKFSEAKMNYIKQNYEHTMFGKEHLFYPAKKAERLLIFFTGALKNRYIMWSWFWRDDEAWKDTAYLFLRDDDFCWYLGNNEKDFTQNYSDIINYYVSESKLTHDKVFTIGGSMGGYGAIYYATILGLKGAIAVCPQVNKASNQGTFGLGSTGKRWQDLDKVVAGSSSKSSNLMSPNISLIFSYYSPDEAAGYALIEALKQKLQTTIIRRHPALTHQGGSGLSKKFVEDEIAYLEQQSPLETKGFSFDEESDEFYFA